MNYGREAYLYESLVGKTVNKIYIGPGDEDLAFVTDNGTFIYATEGDCCSHSWYNDVTGVRSLLGQKVNSVQARGTDSLPYDEDNYEYVQIYGHSLFTSWGACDIVFRNGSNGYYGGWSVLAQAGYLPNLETWTEIKGDWSA